MKYKAFVSSTFEDLKDHRAYVISSLRKAGFHVDPMEDWTADSDAPKKFSQDRLEGCDLCVLLVAFRRGHRADGGELSITQLEYRAAIKRGVDVLPFLLEESAPWAHQFYELEIDPQCKLWRDEIQDSHGVEFFGLEPRSIDMTGALGRWLAKKNTTQTKPVTVERIDWPVGKSPYPGLLWFPKEYADLFFGRDREVDAVIAKMNEPGGRFMVVSGASGSGKSSLVAAGVWRALLKEGRVSGSTSWAWLRIQPSDGETPFDSLASGLKHLFPGMTKRPKDVARELAENEVTIGALIDEQMTHEPELVLFIDQLEELFTQNFQVEDIKDFLNLLVKTVHEPRNRLRVVSTVRSEFIARLEETESVLAVLNRGYNYHLGPVSPRILQEMIEKPAWATGYQFESQLVDTILKETAQEPGTLPLVAYALKILFEHPREQTFTREAYKAMNGVAGAIGTQADRVMGELDKDARHAFERVFAELVHVEHGRPPTRKRVPLALFLQDQGAQKLINALAGRNCRVLVTSGNSDEAVVEVAHEKLFEAWPLLRNYISDHQKQLMDKALLESRAQKWAEMDKPWFSGLALGRERKDFARTGIPTELTKQYLNASFRGQVMRAMMLLVPLAVMLSVVGWLSSQNMTLSQAALKAQSSVMSIHLEPIMKPVPAGTFKQGDSEERRSDERPLHEVTIPSFLIGQTEVTFDEYDRFVIATDGQFSDDKGWGRDSRPVINVSWDDAKKYADWLSQETGKRYRLPTESEWEYAARSAGTDETWAGTSDENQLANYAVFGRGLDEGTEPVGGKKPNGLSLYDMSGNVWEWVEDCWHGNYEGAPKDGSAWLEAGGGACNRRVVRGGSWVISYPVVLRTVTRSRYYTDIRYDGIGFRLVQAGSP